MEILVPIAIIGVISIVTVLMLGLLRFDFRLSLTPQVHWWLALGMLALSVGGLLLAAWHLATGGGSWLSVASFVALAVMWALQVVIAHRRVELP